MNILDNKIVIHKTDRDGIGNVLKGFITAYSIYDNTTIECNPEYIFGNYDTILDSKHISTNLENCNYFNYFYTCRLMVLKSEENEQQNIINEFQQTDRGGNHFLYNLFSTNTFIDWNYDSSKICDKIKKRIFLAIDRISFNPLILEEYYKIKSNCSNSLGISVRTWNCKHENNINRPYDSTIYKDKIKEVLENNSNINIIYLSIDNDDKIEEYSNYCKSLKNSCEIIILNNYLSEKYNPLQHTLLKVLILSLCSEFICNRISTFSELVFWFSKCSQKVYPLF